MQRVCLTALGISKIVELDTDCSKLEIIVDDIVLVSDVDLFERLVRRVSIVSHHLELHQRVERDHNEYHQR